MLIKFHTILSLCLATLDHASTCCHDCCCLATGGNHGLTEPEVCPDDLCHKQFKCADIPAYSHTNTHTDTHVCKFKSIPKKKNISYRNPNKQLTPSVMSLLSWKPPSRDCPFFSTPENSLCLSSFFPHLLYLPHPLPCLLSAPPMIKLMCSKTHKTHAHTRTHTHA